MVVHSREETCVVNSVQTHPVNGNCRRLRRVIWLCIGVVAVTALGVFLWHLHGQATQVSHRSALVFLREGLLTIAEREGKYPLDLQEAIRSSGVSADLDKRNLVYQASGKPYDPQGSQKLFYELKARRYGFEVGSFMFYQDHWDFVPDHGGGR